MAWKGTTALVAILVLLAIALSAEPRACAGGGKKEPPRKEPKKLDPNVFVKPGLKQLYARFTAWDENQDDTLDKGELARAFRGPKARAFDYDKDTDRNTLADYQFLVLVNKNKDDQLSRKEFESWAKKYAKLVDDLEGAREDYAKAVDRLRSAKTASSKRSAQTNFQKRTQELNDLNAQWNSIPAAIHKALNARR
jgi:hypothetical protein